MANSHLRGEKDCLNCNANLYGRYCHECGQENLEPKETLWQFIKSVFKSLTQFDSKLLKSLRYLLFRPGYLTIEYSKGRRVGLLSPLSLYFYVSAVFFLLLSSIFTESNNKQPDNLNKNNTGVISSNPTAPKDTLHLVANNLTAYQTSRLLFSDCDSTPSVYDARQASLSESKRDGWLYHYVNKKIAVANQYGLKHPKSIGRKIILSFEHSFPKIFFISLPLFALVLFVLYFRRRKTYNYVSHIIFSLHFYCASFIILSFWLVFSKISSSWHSLKYVGSAIILYIFVYEFIAMLRFYRQGWMKTSIKFLAINILFIGMTGALTLLAIINAMLNVAG